MASLSGQYIVSVDVYMTVENFQGNSSDVICTGTNEFEYDSIQGNICNLQAMYYVEYPTTGNQDGMIQMNVWGGSGDYSFMWNTGATTQDLYEIGEGSYSVTITDLADTSCSVVLYDIYVFEMDYDTSWNEEYVDTFSTVLDTCLPSYNVDTFYFDNIEFSEDTSEFPVIWDFVIENDTFPIEEIYDYEGEGYYWLSLGFNCNNNFDKAVTSYGRSVYIYPTITNVGNVLLSKVQLYPNPVNNKLNIMLFSQDNQKVNVKISSLTGKTVLSTNSILNVGNNLISLDVSKLQKGAYIISISKGTTMLWTNKIIK